MSNFNNKFKYLWFLNIFLSLKNMTQEQREQFDRKSIHESSDMQIEKAIQKRKLWHKENTKWKF